MTARHNLDIILNAKDKTGPGLKGVERAVRGAAKTIAGVGVAATAALAAGTAELARRQLASIDAMAKTADRIGFSTEALSAYTLGAEKAGVSQDTLNASLLAFSRRLAFAARDTGAANRAYEELGLNAGMLLELAPEDALKVVVERLGDVANETERAGFAFELFGEAGQRLLQFIGGGADGLAAMEAEARQLGITFSREQARGVEDFNDAISDMQAAFAGVGRTLAIEVSPALTEFADFLTRHMAGLSVSVEGLVGAFGEAETAGVQSGDAIVAAWEPVADVIEDTLQVIDAIPIALNNTRAFFADFVGFGVSSLNAAGSFVDGLYPHAVDFYDNSLLGGGGPGLRRSLEQVGGVTPNELFESVFGFRVFGDESSFVGAMADSLALQAQDLNADTQRRLEAGGLSASFRQTVEAAAADLNRDRLAPFRPPELPGFLERLATLLDGANAAGLGSALAEAGRAGPGGVGLVASSTLTGAAFQSPEVEASLRTAINTERMAEGVRDLARELDRVKGDVGRLLGQAGSIAATVAGALGGGADAEPGLANAG